MAVVFARRSHYAPKVSTGPAAKILRMRDSPVADRAASCPEVLQGSRGRSPRSFGALRGADGTVTDT